MKNVPWSDNNNLVQIQKRKNVPVYNMTTQDGAKVYSHLFLTLALDRCRLINFTIWSLYHGENIPGTNSIVGCVSLKEMLNALEEMRSPFTNRTKTARL